MEKRKYNTTRRDTILLIKGVSRKKRNAFKRKYKDLLKREGLNLTEFYIKVLEDAFENPNHVLSMQRKGIRSLFSTDK